MQINENYYIIFQQLQKIVTLYEEVEEIIQNIKNLFSVSCPRGCGQCCNTTTDNIEASITEMLPLCMYLYEQNTYHEWLEKANQQHCVFYDANNQKNNSGCCLVYELRPLVCRLFGFSFKKNKYGAIVPVTCSVLKKQYNDKSKFIAVNKDFLPMMSSFTLQSIMIDPMRSDRFPINKAFVKAMEYIIFKIRFMENNSDYNKIA